MCKTYLHLLQYMLWCIYANIQYDIYISSKWIYLKVQLLSLPFEFTHGWDYNMIFRNVLGDIKRWGVNIGDMINNMLEKRQVGNLSCLNRLLQMGTYTLRHVITSNSFMLCKRYPR